jgi:hypothetical protein
MSNNTAAGDVVDIGIEDVGEALIGMEFPSVAV